MEEHRTLIEGVETYSRTMGTGRDLLLIHGVGVSSRYWVPAQQALAATGRFRVHAVDFPGFGRSATPPWPLTFRRLADHLERWVEATLPAEVDLVGQSLGSEFAVLGACRMADRVRRVVLAAPNGLPESRSVTAQLFWAAVDLPRERLDLLAAILPDYLRCGPLRILRMLAEQRDDRAEELLPLIRQPVLLLRGERDAVVDRERLERIFALLPAPEIRTIPGAHGAHFTHPTPFATEVTRFLTGAADP